MTVSSSSRGGKLTPLTPTLYLTLTAGGHSKERGNTSHQRVAGQQQPATPTTVSPQASRAFELYKEYVLAGQWARFTIE